MEGLQCQARWSGEQTRFVCFPVDTGAPSSAVIPLVFTYYVSLEKGQEMNLLVFKMWVGSGSCVCRKVTCYEAIIKILRDFCHNKGGNFSPIDSLKFGFQVGNRDT